MRQKLVTLLTVIGAVTVLVLAGNTVAYAATGGKFFLGKTNKAGKASTLRRTTNGTALNVVTKRSTDAPLAVNGRGRVANLNADTVDGIDSSAMANRSYRFAVSTSTSTSTADFVVVVPRGSYQVGYSVFFDTSSTDPSHGIDCYVGSGTDTTAGAAINQPTPSSSVFNPALSGSGVITTAPNGKVTLECFSSTSPGNAATFEASGELTLTSTRVVRQGSVTARTGAPRARQPH